MFRFRFVSVPLVAEYLRKDKSTIYEQLLVLGEQGYLHKSYDSSYRLQLKSATYSLAAKGIKHLRDTSATHDHDTALRTMYKNRAASEQLVQQSLKIFKVCIQLQRQYPDVFDIFTKSEMSGTEGFVRPLPDLYLVRNKRSKDNEPPDSYMLELLEPSIPSWRIRKRIRAHQDVTDEVEYTYPHILFVVTNDSTEKRIQSILENCIQDFEFWTTTSERLDTSDTAIWREVFEDDENDKPILKQL